jgi:nicotinamide mononucleotide transporter
MSNLEIAANGFNVISIYLARRNSHHTWWTGLIGCLLFGVLFYQVKLYADVTLQVFFVLTCLFGIWNWLHGGEARTELPVTRSQPRTFTLLVLAAFALTGLYGWLLHAWTDASLPFIDSTVLMLSILAQVLLIERKLENWVVWIAVNVIAVPLYAYKGLYLTAALYAVFLVNAVYGWRAWKPLVKAK